MDGAGGGGGGGAEDSRECFVFMGGAEGECPRCTSLQRRAPQLVARAVQKGLARPAASLLAAAAMEAILAGAALQFKRSLRGMGGAVPPPDLLAALAVNRWAVCIAAAVLAESDRCLLQLRRRVKDEGRGVYLWGGRRVPGFTAPRGDAEAASRVAVRCTSCKSIRPLDYMVY